MILTRYDLRLGSAARLCIFFGQLHYHPRRLKATAYLPTYQRLAIPKTCANCIFLTGSSGAEERETEKPPKNSPKFRNHARNVSGPPKDRLDHAVASLSLICHLLIIGTSCAASGAPYLEPRACADNMCWTHVALSLGPRSLLFILAFLLSASFTTAPLDRPSFDTAVFPVSFLSCIGRWITTSTMPSGQRPSPSSRSLKEPFPISLTAKSSPCLQTPQRSPIPKA